MMMRIAELLNQRLPVSVAGGLAAVAIFVALVFMLSTAGGGPAVSEQDAIAAAIAEVEADGIMTLDGRDTVAEVENGNWRITFPLAIVPQVLWGDLNCSGDVEGGDALDVLRNIGGLDDGGPDGCPDVGTIIDPAAICEDPICSTSPRGGEPIVIVDGTTGLVDNISYSQ